MSFQVAALVIGVKVCRGLQRTLSCPDKDAENLASTLRAHPKLLLKESKEGPLIKLKNEEATTQAIIDHILELPKTTGLKQDGLFLVYFSGFAGKVQEDQRSVGAICPEDVLEETGSALSETVLGNYFDQLKEAGIHNIILILECPARLFELNNPQSFTVLAPEISSERPRGSPFSTALCDVLNATDLKMLTAESLADRIEVQISGKVLRIGKHVDRRIFSSRESPKHYSFITATRSQAYCEIENLFELRAGSAHGISEESVFNMYRSNVSDSANVSSMIGTAIVDKLDIFTSVIIFSPISGIEPITEPCVLYAVEVYNPKENIKVFFSKGSAMADKIKDLKEHPCIQEVKTEEDANLILTEDHSSDERKISYRWNGRAEDKTFGEMTHVIDASIEAPIDARTASKHFRKLRLAARFFYHLSITSAPFLDEKSEPAVKVELRDVTYKERFEPTGKNYLVNNSAHWDTGINKELGPFCLVLHNNSSKFALWPHVFIFAANGCITYDWYLPPLGGKYPTLKREAELWIGCGAEESLILTPENGIQAGSSEITYIKIILTKEKTDMSSIVQYYRSNIEDEVRKLGDLFKQKADEKSYKKPMRSSMRRISSNEHIGKKKGSKALGEVAEHKWCHILLRLSRKYKG